MSKGLDRESFRSDIKSHDAVERCFERICEAARKLGDGLDEAYPEVEFQKLRRMGSVLRHDYDTIDPDILRDAATNHLDLLETACRMETERQKEKTPNHA